MASSAFNPGKLNFLELILTNTDGSRKVNISNLMVNISITEDIFQNTLYGSIRIRDASNLLNGRPSGFPIIGEEFVELKYVTDWLPEPVETSLRFAIYSISEIEYSKNNTVKEYTLGICSEENLIDSVTVVMKGYSGKNSDNFKNIMEDYLYIDQEGKTNQQNNFIFPGKRVKKIDKLQPTKGIQNICIPKLPPLKAANFLARRSISESTFKSGSYLFFENFKGFNFCDIEYLIQKGIEKAELAGVNLDMKDAISDYRYAYEDPVVFEKKTNPREKQIIIRAFHRKFFDTIEKLKRGMFESDILVYDYVNRRVVPTRQRFLNNSDKTNNDSMTLGDLDGKTFPENSITFIKRVTSVDDIEKKFSKHFFIAKDFSETNTDTYLDQIYPSRASYFTRLAQNMFTIDIYGNPNLNAGDVIYIQVPSGNPFKQTQPALNTFISGYYLVGTINHLITLNSYQMKVDIFKNAFSSKVETTDESALTKTTPTDTKALSNTFENELPQTEETTESSSNSFFTFFRNMYLGGI